MPLFPHTDCGLPLHILLQLVHRHPGVRDPVVALVQRRHSRQGQERGDTDGQQTQPTCVGQEMPGLDPDKCKVEQFLTGVYNHGPSQTDEGVDREEETFLLVRLQPEDKQPEVKGGLTEPVRQEDTWTSGLSL